MGMQLSDFNQLKSLKKELQAKEQEQKASERPAASEPVRRSHVVQHRSLHEEHARNEGYRMGQTVRMMDSNDEAVITGFRKDCFELTLPDGLVITATKGEFIIVDKEEDRMMYRSMPSSPKQKRKEEEKRSVSSNEPLTVNLHLEWIPGSDNVPEWAALDFQMDYFRRVLRQNLKHRGRKIVFIHGVGDGILRDAVRKELDEVFAMSCSYTYGTSDNYGSGTVIVTIR